MTKSDRTDYVARDYYLAHIIRDEINRASGGRNFTMTDPMEISVAVAGRPAVNCLPLAARLWKEMEIMNKTDDLLMRLRSGSETVDSESTAKLLNDAAAEIEMWRKSNADIKPIGWNFPPNDTLEEIEQQIPQKVPYDETPPTPIPKPVHPSKYQLSDIDKKEIRKLFTINKDNVIEIASSHRTDGGYNIRFYTNITDTEILAVIEHNGQLMGAAVRNDLDNALNLSYDTLHFLITNANYRITTKTMLKAIDSLLYYGV